MLGLSAVGNAVAGAFFESLFRLFLLLLVPLPPPPPPSPSLPLPLPLPASISSDGLTSVVSRSPSVGVMSTLGDFLTWTRSQARKKQCLETREKQKKGLYILPENKKFRLLYLRIVFFVLTCGSYTNPLFQLVRSWTATKNEDVKPGPKVALSKQRVPFCTRRLGTKSLRGDGRLRVSKEEPWLPIIAYAFDFTRQTRSRERTLVLAKGRQMSDAACKVNPL